MNKIERNEVLVVHAMPITPVDTGKSHVFDFLFKKIAEFLKNNLEKQDCYTDISVLHAMTLINRHYFVYGCAIFQILNNNLLRNMQTNNEYFLKCLCYSEFAHSTYRSPIKSHPMECHSRLIPGDLLLIPKRVRLISGKLKKIYQDLNKAKITIYDVNKALSVIHEYTKKEEGEAYLNRYKFIENICENECIHLIRFLIKKDFLDPTITWYKHDEGRICGYPDAPPPLGFKYDREWMEMTIGRWALREYEMRHMPDCTYGRQLRELYDGLWMKVCQRKEALLLRAHGYSSDGQGNRFYNSIINKRRLICFNS